MKYHAVWNETILAEADESQIEQVEGNIYFPKNTVKSEYFEETQTHTVCGWKGTASYYTINVNGEKNVDAAWYYPETLEKANHIKDYIAFWKGVEVKKID